MLLSWFGAAHICHKKPRRGVSVVPSFKLMLSGCHVVKCDKSRYGVGWCEGRDAGRWVSLAWGQHRFLLVDFLFLAWGYEKLVETGNECQR